MSIVKVPVPFRRQPNPDYCVPTCLWMINEFLRKTYGEKEVKKLSIKKIANQIQTQRGGGTEFKNIPRINELYNSKKYYIKFNAKHPCQWQDIITENGKRKPLIAWVWLSNDDSTRGVGHSVVICNVDEPNGDIYYNDPAKNSPSFREDIPSFFSKWEDENVDYTLITFKVEKKTQTHLPEYSKNGESKT